MSKIVNMSTSTKPREMPRRAENPAEIEARMLLALGVKPGPVHAITGLDTPTIGDLQIRMSIYGHGPWVATQIARLIGLDYRNIYRLVQRGEMESTQWDGKTGVTQRQLRSFCRAYLNRDGMRRAKYLLFAGVNTEIAAFRAGVDRPSIRGLLRELKDAGVGPKSEGPYSLTQASKVLDIEPRMIRRYCQEGRLGREVPSDDALEYGIKTKYLITRDDILEFGAQPRQVGKPGQVARTVARNTAKNNHAHSKNGRSNTNARS
jgi:hypothetical protein